MARPDLPRTSSSGSGFFFCGIMLLPVLSASDSSKNRCSSPHRMIRSSASRLRCTIVMRAGVEERGGEIAVGRGVHAVVDDAREAEVARERVDVDGVGVPAMAPLPSGSASASSRAPPSRVEIAPQRRDVRQKEMRDEHRLRRTEMRERRHQRVAGRRRLRGQRVDDARDGALQQRNAAAQIQPQIERHLLVARSAGVQPAAGVAEPLDQQPLDEAVDVLVGAVDECRVGSALARACPRAPASIWRGSSASARRRFASARAHAMLPVTSSSNRRRSKRNEAPNSNAAASGAVSKRPDQSVVISL